MAYSQMTTAETDADSPLNETLFTKIKDNFDAIVDSGTSKIATDMVTQASVAAAAIGRGELKTALEENSQVTGVGTQYHFNFSSAGEYGHYPEFKTTAGNVTSSHTVALAVGATYVTYCSMLNSGVSTTTIAMRYVQASPPYRLGDEPDWGQFLYLIRNKSTGEIWRSHTCQDAPWAYLCRRLHLPKDHPGAPLQRPHPFVDCPDQIPDNHEIVLVDLREFNERQPHLPMKRQYLAMLKRRHELLAAGVPELELDEAERSAKAKSDDESKRADQWLERVDKLSQEKALTPAALTKLRSLALPSTKMHEMHIDMDARGTSFLHEVMTSADFDAIRKSDEAVKIKAPGMSGVRIVGRK